MDKEQWDRRMLMEVGIMKGSISNIKTYLEKTQYDHLISPELYQAYINFTKKTEHEITKLMQLMFRS